MLEEIEQEEIEKVAVERVRGACQSYMGVTEHGGDNCGEMVGTILRSVGLSEGLAWCAAFVYRIGYYALLNPATKRSNWPLPTTGSCWVLGDFARQRGVLVKEPKVGDVFLVYNNKANPPRFHHTGFVVHVNADGSCICVEGNTNDDGSANGRAVLLKPRTFSVKNGDRFIRWTRLLSQEGK